MCSFKQVILFAICAGLLLSKLALAQDNPLFVLHHPVQQNGAIYTIRVSPDNGRLLTAGSNGVKVWNLNDGKLLLEITDFENIVRTAAFSWDGNYIVTGDWARKIKIWDSHSGQFIQEFQDPETHDPTGDFVFGVAFSPDGRKVLSSQWYKNDLWDIATGQMIKRLPDVNARATRDLFFMPDGERAVFWSDSVKVLNVNTGQLLHSFPSYATMITPDRQKVITVEGGMKIWDLNTGKNLYDSDILFEGKVPVIFPDAQGYKLAYTTYEGNVAVDQIGINSTLTRSEVKTFTKEMNNNYNWVLFSKDGGKIILATADTVYVYDSSVLTSAIKGAEGYE